MAEDLPPSPFIKKRPKGSIRPSGSTSSLRSLAASPGGSTLSFAQDDGDDDDGGNVAVIRSRGKKTPAGRVKDREGVAKKSGRLSFGGGDEVSGLALEAQTAQLTLLRYRRKSQTPRSWSSAPIHPHQPAVVACFDRQARRLRYAPPTSLRRWSRLPSHQHAPSTPRSTSTSSKLVPSRPHGRIAQTTTMT